MRELLNKDLVTEQNDVSEKREEQAEKGTSDEQVMPTAEAVKIKMQKNYGIELLRILSMIFIVILHVINFGGIGYYHSGVYFPITEQNTGHYMTQAIILAFCYCAVNCYGLISGYVGCKSKFKPSKMISLWLTVVSINGIIHVVSYLYNPEWVSAYGLSYIFMPLLKDEYWYFTAYMGLLVLMPFINAGVNNLSKKQYTYMLMGFVVFFSIFPSVSGKDLFKLSAGYSMLHLIIMYIVGAYFRLHVKKTKRPVLVKAISLAIYIISALSLAFFRFFKEKLFSLGENGIDLYVKDYSYTSLFVLICSVSLFVFFMNVNIKNKYMGRIIGCVSSVTFGVYIIHLNYIVFEKVFTGRFVNVALETPFMMGVGIVLWALVLFAVCGVMEKIRQLLFKLSCLDKLISLADKCKLKK